MQKLLELTVGLVLVGAVFGLLHRFSDARHRQRFFREEFRTDVLWWYFRFTIGSALVNLSFLVGAIPIALALGLRMEDFKDGYHGFGPLASLPAEPQVILFLLLFDFSLYWNHRLFHSGRWWKYHAIHHSPEIVDWLSAVRVHPLNDFIGNLLTLVPILLLGFNPGLVAPFGVIVSFYALVVHADLDWDLGPLRYVIVSPAFHRWHHSKDAEAVDKNFAALFPIWDLIFGTFYMPPGKRPSNFGIPDPIPKSLWGQLLHPLLRVNSDGQTKSTTPPVN